jgi:hypothetical protein
MKIIVVRSILIFSLLILILQNISIDVQGKSYTVTDDLKETHEVAPYLHNSYNIDSVDKKFEVEVNVIEGSSLDFYLLTEEQYSDYKRSLTQGFEYVEVKENSKRVSWKDADEKLVFVVDNAPISASGAIPTDNVTYEIVIKYSELNFFERNFCYSGTLLCPAMFFSVLAVYYWLNSVPKKYRENAKILEEKY